MQVNKPLFELFGLRLHIQLQRPGFYPKGGALGKVFMEPVPFTKIHLTTGKLKSIDVFSSASTDLKPEKVAELQLRGFKSVIKNVTQTFAGYAPATSSGFACSSIIKYEGNSIKGIARIGDSKISGDENGRLTAQETKEELENSASVDEQLADQLILPLCFAPSGSSYTFDKIYPHVKTNLEVINIIMGDILSLEKLSENLHKLTRK